MKTELDCVDVVQPDGTITVLCRHGKTWPEGGQFTCDVCRDKAIAGFPNAWLNREILR